MTETLLRTRLVPLIIHAVASRHVAASILQVDERCVGEGGVIAAAGAWPSPSCAPNCKCANVAASDLEQVLADAPSHHPETGHVKAGPCRASALAELR